MVVPVDAASRKSRGDCRKDVLSRSPKLSAKASSVSNSDGITNILEVDEESCPAQSLQSPREGRGCVGHGQGLPSARGWDCPRSIATPCF